MIGQVGEYVWQFGYGVASTVPQPIQLAVGFILYPLFWISFLHLILCIPVVGVFIPFFVVGDFTNSIRLAFLATALAPALDFLLLAFGMAWARKSKKLASAITTAWIGIIVFSVIVWLAYPIFT